jgi:hypothetical protein
MSTGVSLPLPLRGIRNTLAPNVQPAGAMASVVNLDHTAAGALEQRRGLLAAVDAAIDDAYQPPTGGVYYLAGGSIYFLGEDFTPRRIVDGLTDTRLAWAFAGTRVFYAGTQDAGCLRDGRTWEPLRLPRPRVTAAALSSGGLAAGDYQVSAVYQHVESGLMGGAYQSVKVKVRGGGALSVRADELPGFETMVYVSDPNDKRCKFIGNTFDGTLVVTRLPEKRVLLADERELATNIPQGVTALAWHDGRLCAATFNSDMGIGRVWRSGYGTPNLFRFDPEWLAAPDQMPVTVQGRVNALQSRPDGLWVWTAEQTWRYPTPMDPQFVAGYGAPAGLPVAVGQSGSPVAWTRYGWQLADGSTPMFDKVSFPMGDAARAGVLTYDGATRLAVVTDGLGRAANAYGFGAVSLPQEIQLTQTVPQVSSYAAGVALGGHRMVVIDDGVLVYADASIPDHGERVLGMTLGAVSEGEAAIVQTGGFVSEPSWNLIPDLPIYLALSGQISQIPPTSGFLLALGSAVSETKVYLNPEVPIYLS